jgi:hypothetical protein
MVFEKFSLFFAKGKGRGREAARRNACQAKN